MMTSNAFGVAFFKDGRVAAKEFVVSSDLRKGSGPIRGYSTYTFDDGSSITASFTGEFKEGQAHGIYTMFPARALTLTPRARGVLTALQRGSRALIFTTVSSM